MTKWFYRLFKIALLSHGLYVHAWSATDNDTSSLVYRCNVVFEERKEELVDLLDSISDEKQVLDSLNEAAQVLIDKRTESLNKLEQRLNDRQREVDIRLALIQEERKKYEEILAKIQEITRDKVKDAYTKMSPGKAAGILNNMPSNEAADILYMLQAKNMSTILEKMTPDKASAISLLIKKGPEFKQDLSTFAIKEPKGVKDAIQKDFK